MANTKKQKQSAKTNKAASASSKLKSTGIKSEKSDIKTVKPKSDTKPEPKTKRRLATKLNKPSINSANLKYWLKFSFKWILITAIIFFFVGGPIIAAWMNDRASKDAQKKQEEVQKQIEEYQKKVQEEAAKPKEVDPSLKVDGDVTELQVIDEKTGDGPEVKAGDSVKVKYKGALAKTGEVFDSNDQGMTISLNQVIEGWKEGIPGMKVGGVRILKIPSDKGYGDQASGSIPAGSDLVFRVELLEVNPSQ